MLDNQKIAMFKAAVRGGVTEPTDKGYDAARALYNGMIDKRPRLIARCTSAADVISSEGRALHFFHDKAPSGRYRFL